MRRFTVDGLVAATAASEPERFTLTLDAAFDEPQEEVAGAHACEENVMYGTSGQTTFAALLHGSLASVPRTIRVGLMLSFAIFFSKFGYAAIREILREIWVSVAKFRQHRAFRSHFGVFLLPKSGFGGQNAKFARKFRGNLGEIWAHLCESAKQNLGGTCAKDSIRPTSARRASISSAATNSPVAFRLSCHRP